MPQPLSFITANPATDTFRRQSEERTAVRQAEQRDQAFRQGLSAREDLDPAAAAMMRAEGGGETAFAMQSQRDESRERQERLAIEALGRGDMEVFDYYSRASGLNIPQEIVGDARVRAMFARAALTAEQVYGSDNEQQAAGFVQAYLATGDALRAYEMTGAPFGGGGRRGGGGRAPSADAVVRIDEQNGQWLTRRDGNPYLDRAPEGYGYYQRDGETYLREFPVWEDPPPPGQPTTVSERPMTAAPPPAASPPGTVGMIPQAPSYAYSATNDAGVVIYSNDGVNWVDANGRPFQSQ